MPYTPLDISLFSVGETLHGFTVEHMGDIPQMNASYVKLTHKASGATLYYSNRDDSQLLFSVGFSTFPEDDTGVFHILEHSCLDGSQNFPLKEPFVNLIKTSMAVDLNAMTYQDRTVYYFITTHEQDFMNMMSVYLDAVFYPLLLSDPRIFEKEAWHLEPDEQGGLTCSGVVYNEMQGHENRPEYLLWQKATSQLFPERFDRFNSGGDPGAIRTLTYEKFCETYRRFYGSDNAVFYLSGKLPKEALVYLDNLLTARPAMGYQPPEVPKPHPPVISPDGVVYYQLSEQEEIQDNTQLMLGYVLPVAYRDAQTLALSLLSRYLAETTQSPLSDAVLSAGVGQEFSMGIDSDNLEGMVYFTLGKSNPECAEDFQKVILDTLRQMVDKGFDHDRLMALVDSHETDVRRVSLRTDAGFRIMESFMRAQVLTGDAKPLDGLAKLRENLAETPNYFEDIVKESILEGQHWSLTRCIPSRTIADERAAMTQAWLDAQAEIMAQTTGGMEHLQAHVDALNEYLLAEDDPHAVAKIPHLTPAHITLPPMRRDMDTQTTPMGGMDVTSLHYQTNANGMSMAGILLDIKNLDRDELFYIYCLKRTLLDLPTTSHDVDTLCDILTRLHTVLDVNLTQVVTGGGPDDFAHYLHLRVDAPESKLAEAVALLGEYMTQIVFDKDILKRLLVGSSAFRNRLISSGNATAISMAEQSLTYAGVARWELAGVPALTRLTSLSQNFDTMVDDLVVGLQKVYQKLMCGVKPVVYHIGSQASYDTWQNALQALPLKVKPLDGKCAFTLHPKAHAGLAIPGGVNYCAEIYDLGAVGAKFVPQMLPVSSYLYSTYFWDEIRAKGGAYGGSCVAYPYGILALVSYRDPRVADTYDVYARLPAWLQNHLPSQDEVDSLIVSTLGQNYFIPQSPIDEGVAALMRYLRGKTAEERQNDIAQILTTTPQNFADFADMVAKLQQGGHGVRAALGGEDALRASGLFDSITEL